MLKLFSYIILFIGSVSFAQSTVPAGASLEKVAGGFQFLEGPVWKDSVGLLFSDMGASTIFNYTPDGKIKIFLKPSDVSNGLTYDLQGRLILTQTGLRRVARLEPDGTQTLLASTYNEKKLNSPNDVAVKSDGSIFFTDPPFNIPSGQKQELPFSGIFRISGTTGALQLLDSTLAFPNGICFSPDEKKLYVNDSQARIIYVWDVANDSTITNKKVFATMHANGYADGMKIDTKGNLFSAGPFGIWVFSPKGTVIDTIMVPGQTTNCNWGDADRKTLYITAGTGLYRIRLTSSTGINGQGYNPTKSFKLYGNNSK